MGPGILFLISMIFVYIYFFILYLFYMFIAVNDKLNEYSPPPVPMYYTYCPPPPPSYYLQKEMVHRCENDNSVKNPNGVDDQRFR
jgi:hypothetical protein